MLVNGHWLCNQSELCQNVIRCKCTELRYVYNVGIGEVKKKELGVIFGATKYRKFFLKLCNRRHVGILKLFSYIHGTE